jgi:hypothetical protein
MHSFLIENIDLNFIENKFKAACLSDDPKYFKKFKLGKNILKL